jgi:hypothetical protein
MAGLKIHLPKAGVVFLTTYANEGNAAPLPTPK